MAGLLDFLLASSQAAPTLPPGQSQTGGGSGGDVTVTAKPKTPPPQAQAMPIPQNIQPFNPGLQFGPMDQGQIGPMGSPGPGGVVPANSTPAPMNYDNSVAAQGVQEALRKDGGAQPAGVYGLLPQGLQHGTLRSALGILGDAFLVGSGRQQQYAPAVQRQEMGAALAGIDYSNPDSVSAAVQRLAATGSPDAIQAADAVQKNYNDLALRKTMMEQNNFFRTGLMNDRNQAIFQRMANASSGAISTATAANYPQLYASLDARVKALDPNMDAATALNIPPPDQFTAGNLAEYGITNAGVQTEAAKAAERGVQTANSIRSTNQSGANAQTAAQARIISSNIANMRPSDANIANGLMAKQNSGQPLSPAEQAWWDANVARKNTGRGRGAGLAPGLAVNGGAGHPAGNGPSQSDVTYLRAHPQMRAQFDAHFGAGASARVLGQ